MLGNTANLTWKPSHTFCRPKIFQELPKFFHLRVSPQNFLIWHLAVSDLVHFLSVHSMYLGTRPSSARVKSHLCPHRDIAEKGDRAFPKFSELIVVIQPFQAPYFLWEIIYKTKCVNLWKRIRITTAFRCALLYAFLRSCFLLYRTVCMK